MSTLHVHLFGNVQVRREGQSLPAKTTRSVQGLLAFLLLHRHRSHPREVLAGQFWGEFSQERARNALNTALWRLRRVLEPEGIPGGTYILTSSTGQIGFNCQSSYWLDMAAFEEQVRPLLAKPVEATETTDAQALEEAIQLYTGDLLEGFSDDWALQERERLRLLHLDCLRHLMGYHRQHGAYQQSLAYGQQILNHDPLREDVHRAMMRLYVESGQRALAVQQYQALCQILSAELGIPPMEETRALHSRIVLEAGHPTLLSAGASQMALLQQALQQLQRATQTLGAAHEQLRQATELIEQLAGGAGSRGANGK